MVVPAQLPPHCGAPRDTVAVISPSPRPSPRPCPPPLFLSSSRRRLVASSSPRPATQPSLTDMGAVKSESHSLLTCASPDHYKKQDRAPEGRWVPPVLCPIRRSTHVAATNALVAIPTTHDCALPGTLESQPEASAARARPRSTDLSEPPALAVNQGRVCDDTIHACAHAEVRDVAHSAFTNVDAE